MKRSAVQDRASFEAVRYAQCWEDSHLLTEGLRPAGRDVLSIGSAGDNSFALLAAGAKSVTAVEMSAAQVACIELRRAGYLALDHGEFLELMGARESGRRGEIYGKCREGMAGSAREFWDGKLAEVEKGIGGAGKFEGYFKLFRERVLPLAHSRERVEELLRGGDREEREKFYNEKWDNWRWRAIFRVFFSRKVMGVMGRDPAFFDFAEGPVAEGILERTRHALVELDPADNPYLWWILTGRHGEVLPEAWEEGNFLRIREGIEAGRFRVLEMPLEEALEEGQRYEAFNLSDIFEYMTEGAARDLLGRVADRSEAGARLGYWNMMVPREGAELLSGRLRGCAEAGELFRRDRAFFYRRFLLEEVIG